MKTSRKISKTFISFLVASFLIWLLITFSKEYTTVITYAVSYKNIPQNKLLQETPIKEIDITVKASGFKILRSNFKNNSSLCFYIRDENWKKTASSQQHTLTHTCHSKE